MCIHKKQHRPGVIVTKHSVQGNGGRKKGGAEKENGVETLTGGAGDENLLKRGGVRSNSSIAPY